MRATSWLVGVCLSVIASSHDASAIGLKLTIHLRPYVVVSPRSGTVLPANAVLGLRVVFGDHTHSVEVRVEDASGSPLHLRSVDVCAGATGSWQQEPGVAVAGATPGSWQVHMSSRSECPLTLVALSGASSGAITVRTRIGTDDWSTAAYTIDPHRTPDRTVEAVECNAIPTADEQFPAAVRAQRDDLSLSTNQAPVALLSNPTPIGRPDPQHVTLITDAAKNAFSLARRRPYGLYRISTMRTKDEPLVEITPIWADGSLGPVWRGRVGAHPGPWSEGWWQGPEARVACNGHQARAAPPSDPPSAPSAEATSSPAPRAPHGGTPASTFSLRGLFAFLMSFAGAAFVARRTAGNPPIDPA